MKKNFKWLFARHPKSSLKIILTMKLILLLTILSTFNLSASVYAQKARFNLSVDGQSVRDVLKMIESQSDFRFFFSDDFQDLEKEISLNIKNENINQVMNSLLAKGTITYKVLNNDVIVLTPLT